MYGSWQAALEGAICDADVAAIAIYLACARVQRGMLQLSKGAAIQAVERGVQRCTWPRLRWVVASGTPYGFRAWRECWKPATVRTLEYVKVSLNAAN